MINLGELAQIESGVVFPNVHQGHTEGDFPFAKVGDISRAVDGGARRISTARNYISQETATRLRARPFPAGTIVFAKIGEAIRLNNRAITTRPMLFDNNVMGVTPRQGAIDLDYLFFYLQTLDFYLLTNTTAVPAIRKSELEELAVPLPAMREQKRIARLLINANNLRCTRRYALETCDELLPASFIKIFGDPFSAQAGELVRLDDILAIQPQNGLYAPTDRYTSADDLTGTKTVHMSDLFGGIVAPQKLKRILLDPSEIAKYGLSDGDILIARRSLNYEGAHSLVGFTRYQSR